MRERGTWLVPTLSVTLGGFRYHRDLVPDFAVPKLEAAREAHLDSFRRAYRAGVRIAMGTDFPNIRKGETLAQELGYMVEAGMTPLDALIAGTANGAELLGLTDLGRIEPGARAALLLVDGDPTQDIARGRGAASPHGHPSRPRADARIAPRARHAVLKCSRSCSIP